jgi:inosose dehydratase
MHNLSLNRRRFVAAGSVAAAALGFKAASPAWAFTANARLQLGIQLYSLRGFDLPTALKHAADVGFTQVEFYSGMLPLEASPETIAKTKKQVADLGMSISAHGVNRVGKDEAANRKLFDFAKALGIKTITIDPDPGSFDQLDELVKAYDIRVAIHNHGPTHRYNKVVDVLHAIEGHDVRIGACADLGHFIRSGEQPVDVIRLLKGRLYGIHLKDFAAMEDKADGVILGKGHLDVERVIDALVAVEFPADGALSLEYEENPKDPIADIKACYAIAKSAIDKVNRASS